MAASLAPAGAATVVALAALDRAEIAALLDAYGARLVAVSATEAIPGSYWGDSEAGLIGNAVYVRADTAAHSFLHELSHYVCMSADRRATLSTDAGGDDAEEAGVCYLQVLLADGLRGFGAARCLSDMDAWGYSFREGSARAWFAGDGVHAEQWLRTHCLIDSARRPTLQLR